MDAAATGLKGGRLGAQSGIIYGHMASSTPPLKASSDPMQNHVANPELLIWCLLGPATLLLSLTFQSRKIGCDKQSMPTCLQICSCTMRSSMAMPAAAARFQKKLSLLPAWATSLHFLNLRRPKPSSSSRHMSSLAAGGWLRLHGWGLVLGFYSFAFKDSL